MKLTLAEVGEIVGAAVSGAGHTSVTGYSIDSRTIQPGDLFFALKGPNFDGHDFVGRALEAGAAGAVVERNGTGTGGALLEVPNTVTALESLAAAVRQRWGRPLLAVTGSAGKTSTKDLTAALLATRYRTLKSEGNLNNQYGLPLSLLRADETHEIGVFELGMSHAGEIAHLAAIARPETAIVTCVAPVHLEFFAGIEGIAAAKRELVESLPPGGLAVLNADDPRVSQFADHLPVRCINFGLCEEADFRAEDIREHGLRGTSFTVRWEGPPEQMGLALIGRHNILNALAALAAAEAYGVPPAAAADALREFRPGKMRGQVSDWQGAAIVNDCYNSNPRALEFMLDALARTAVQGRRIAVLGEMRELGAASAELHRAAGHHAAQAVDYLVAVAGDARYFLEGAIAAGLSRAHTAFFDSAAEAGPFVASLLQPGDIALFKASRGVKLERALEFMQTIPHSPFPIPHS